VGLTVTVLGCSGSYPGPGEACSGYLVRSDRTTLWADAGTGTLANLQRHVTLADVDAVLLSHEHPDHWTDINGFYVASKYYERRGVVPIYAPASVRDHAYYDDEPFLWHDVTDADTITVGDVRVSFSRTDHGPETLAMRFESGGRSLGYSADSGPAWSLEALGPDLDLALCEAGSATHDEGRLRHMSPRQAGRSARSAGVDRLVLTHLAPGLDAVQTRIDGADAFGDEVDIAHAGAIYTV
jgi:ribonuclease BN (tRNA processing enzyme)